MIRPLGTIAVLAASLAFDAEAARPNIVFLFSDDRSPRAVGGDGDSEAITGTVDVAATIFGLSGEPARGKP